MVATTPLLQVSNLQVQFKGRRGQATVLNGVSFDLHAGETLCVVGESGCGKSMTALALLGLIPHPPGEVCAGQILFQKEDLLKVSTARLREVRGNRISMIFQEPMTSLNPVFTVGDQIGESLRLHAGLNSTQAREQAIEMLRQVGIPAPERRVDEYPHQLSGGMRQRVMIAMALINDPELLIADEPTTALDVTVQAQIIELLRDLQKEFGTAIVLITHDLGVVADVADDVIVMYGGSAAEQGPVREIFYQPEMPYTWGLLSSIPKESDEGQLDPIPGTPPSLIHLPKGCVFNPRCAYKELVPGGVCESLLPVIEITGPNHAARCHLTSEQRATIRSEKKIGK